MRALRSLRSLPDGTILASFAVKAVIAILLAGLVMAITMAGTLRADRPVAALAWTPSNGVAMANWAAGAIQADKGRTSRARAKSVAVRALERDPAAVPAWRALALAAEADGSAEIARRRFAIVEQLTKRDQPTHMWLVTKYVSERRSAQLMAQLDLALRTSKSNWEQLLPLLVGLSAEPQLVPPLIEHLKSGPNWRDAFMGRLAAISPNLETAARLSADLDPAIPAEREWIGTLLKRMADERRFALAWRYNARVTGSTRDSPPAQVHDGSFEGDAPYPFGWMLSADPDISAQRGTRPGAKGNSLLLATADRKSGEAARQLLALPRGSYRLSARAGGLPDAQEERPVLQLSCVDAAAPLVRIQPGGGSETSYAGIARVPPNCAWQWLTIEVRGSDPDSLEVPWIDDVAVTRLGI